MNIMKNMKDIYKSENLQCSGQENPMDQTAPLAWPKYFNEISSFPSFTCQ